MTLLAGYVQFLFLFDLSLTGDKSLQRVPDILDDENAQFFMLPPNSGLSHARNTLVYLYSPYCFRMQIWCTDMFLPGYKF